MFSIILCPILTNDPATLPKLLKSLLARLLAAACTSESVNISLIFAPMLLKCSFVLSRLALKSSPKPSLNPVLNSLASSLALFITPCIVSDNLYPSWLALSKSFLALLLLLVSVESSSSSSSSLVSLLISSNPISMFLAFLVLSVTLSIFELTLLEAPAILFRELNTLVCIPAAFIRPSIFLANSVITFIAPLITGINALKIGFIILPISFAIVVRLAFSLDT